MHVFAYEGGGFHVAEGLWPVLVAGGLSVLLLLAFMLLVLAYPRWRAPAHTARRLVACIGLLMVITVALFAYADHRFRDCLDDGNHPWDTEEYIQPGQGVCERVVVGDVLTRPDR